MAIAPQNGSSSDLSNLIISMDEIIGKLNSFFTHAVILKTDYQVDALGSEVESYLGFSSSEIAGQAFARLCVEPRTVDTIREELRRGHFDGINTTLLNRDHQPVRVSLSGFYLGLISDINGYIILKVKLLEDNSFLRKELVTKKQELDSFVYRTAHDLRGPIATIKGLVNLLKMRQDAHEVDELTELIEIHANKLDDRLFKLLYVADDNYESDDCVGVVDLARLKDRLCQVLKNNCQIEHLVFEFHAGDQSLPFVDECRLTRLISNLLLYIVGLPIAAVPAQGQFRIAVTFESLPGKLNVRIHAKGFKVTDNIREAITQPASLYNDVLSYPLLFNYYVAQRDLKKLNGLLLVEFASEDEQLIRASLPLYFSPARQGKRQSEIPGSSN